MALIKLSAIGITNLSGKAGGSVFSHNQGGMYAKNFVVPTNPNTLAQQKARGQFGSMATLYSSLDANVKEGWKQSTVNFPYTNRLGDQKTLSAISLFVSLNSTLEEIGQPVVTTPPTFMAPEQAKGLQVVSEYSATPGASTLVVSGTTFATGTQNTQVLIQATKVHPAESITPQGGYRTIGSTATPSNAFSVDLIDSWQSIYGNLPDSGRIFVKVTPVSILNGQRGASISESGNITAAG